MATLVDERTLDERLARLEAARPWSPRVVSRLEALIRADDDAALFRINPFTFASERGLGEDEAIDLLLHAAALGLFEMDWLLVCPRCACAVESFAGLRAVQRRFRCPECRNEYEAAMDDLIAIYFSVSPQIRAIRYHRPETLDPFDYIYGFKGVREGRMPDGGPFLDAARSALRGVAFLEPGETARFTFEAAPGALWGFSSDTAAGFELEVGGEPTAEPQQVRLTFLGTGYQPARPPWPRARSRSRSTTRHRPVACSPSPRSRRARKASFWPSTPISPASTCSPARRSGACSVPRWWAAPKASRSAT